MSVLGDIVVGLALLGGAVALVLVGIALPRLISDFMCYYREELRKQRRETVADEWDAYEHRFCFWRGKRWTVIVTLYVNEFKPSDAAYVWRGYREIAASERIMQEHRND